MALGAAHAAEPVHVQDLHRATASLPRLRAAGVNVVGLTVATRWPNLRGTLSGWHFRSLGMPLSS